MDERTFETEVRFVANWGRYIGENITETEVNVKLTMCDDA